MTLDHLKDCLENNRLYLNDGKTLNDPFDLAFTNRKTRELTRMEGLRILCLTNSYRKKLMWSYYADGHKGVCLTVSIPSNLVYPVCYTTRRLFDDTDELEILNNSIIWRKRSLIKPWEIIDQTKRRAYIKDKKWEHENEYRIVFNENEPGLITVGDKKFMSVKFKNVYLGVKFDDKSEKGRSIINICKNKNIKISCMGIDDMNYGLRVLKGSENNGDI